MAHGYELEVTPLQTITFYNAIANNGKMMKPMLVKEIRDHDKVVQTFAPEVLAEHVCSPATAMNARRMMETVVNGEHGTGKKLQACLFKVGGKTGTAVINRAGGFNADGTKAYNASFCGYFPADKPKYSCIVFISNPVNGQIYGGEVAMPVFKAVADKVYALDLEFKHPINNSIAATTAPISTRGAVIDIETAAKAMGYNVTASGDGPWASGTMTGKSARVSASNINEKIVPDVTGMSIKDAMYLLENVGLRVKPIGYGKVLRQSVAPGSPVTSNQFITIELAN
jgi:cell division protein FtsI (penicillin-binding protein 3)